MIRWHRHVPLAVYVFASGSVACQRLGTLDEATTRGVDPANGTDSNTSDDAGAEATVTTADPGPVADNECDPTDQSTCADQSKCTAIRTAQGPRYACVEDTPRLLPAASCQSAPGSGIDGCAPGTACISSSDGQGLCLELCFNHEDCPQGGLCIVNAATQVPFCSLSCAPEAADCPLPMGCRRGDNQFTCQFSEPFDSGLSGDECTIANDSGCATGYVCIPGALVPGCLYGQCCASICDVTSDGCPAPTTCEPIFSEPGPGSETVGACLVPS